MIHWAGLIFSPITVPIRFIQNNFKTVVFLTIVISIAMNSDQQTFETTSPNLAQVELIGPIIIADEILQQLDDIKQNDNIKGVLLKINSPGGAVDASVEIAYAIKELNKVKPVVSYASGIIASGSYYASIYSSEIVANPGSMVGSIGVIISGLNTEKLMENLGIQTQTIQAGEYKSVGTAQRAWSGIEKKELKKVINDTYNMFIEDVKKARNLNIDEKEFANGHIFTARQAKAVGLVDEVATITKAKANLKKLSKVVQPVWQKEDRYEKFMKQLNSSIAKTLQTHLSGLKAY